MSAKSGFTQPATNADGTRVCSMADALQLVGDRWSLLVVREIEFGVLRFNDIQRMTGAPRQILTARLKKLVEVGVLAKVEYTSHPPRFEYHLTESGNALWPVIRDLRKWGETHATPQVHVPLAHPNARSSPALSER